MCLREDGEPVEAVEWRVGGWIHRRRVDRDFKKIQTENLDKSGYRRGEGGEERDGEEDQHRGGATMLKLKFWVG